MIGDADLAKQGMETPDAFDGKTPVESDYESTFADDAAIPVEFAPAAQRSRLYFTTTSRQAAARAKPGQGAKGDEVMEFRATVQAGRGAEPARADAIEATWSVPNPRADGTTVATAFTGAHLLHLAVAGCVLNDVYREAQQMGVELESVRVSAWGGFTGPPYASTGIEYAIEIESPAPDDDLRRLLEHVDEIAEIPSALRAGMTVARADAT